jgi:hypothetical protein
VRLSFASRASDTLRGGVNVRFGQKQTSDYCQLMSALPPTADIVERNRHVRFVPISDISRHTQNL